MKPRHLKLQTINQEKRCVKRRLKKKKKSRRKIPVAADLRKLKYNKLFHRSRTQKKQTHQAMERNLHRLQELPRVNLGL